MSRDTKEEPIVAPPSTISQEYVRLINQWTPQVDALSPPEWLEEIRSTPTTSSATPSVRIYHGKSCPSLRRMFWKFVLSVATLLDRYV